MSSTRVLVFRDIFTIYQPSNWSDRCAIITVSILMAITIQILIAKSSVSDKVFKISTSESFITRYENKNPRDTNSNAKGVLTFFKTSTTIDKPDRLCINETIKEAKSHIATATRVNVAIIEDETIDRIKISSDKPISNIEPHK